MRISANVYQQHITRQILLTRKSCECVSGSVWCAHVCVCECVLGTSERINLGVSTALGLYISMFCRLFALVLVKIIIKTDQMSLIIDALCDVFGHGVRVSVDITHQPNVYN